MWDGSLGRGRLGGILVKCNPKQYIALHMKDDQYSFRLPRQVVGMLEEAAKLRGVPKAQLVREALVEFLERPAVAEPWPAGVRPAGRLRSLGSEAGGIRISDDFDAPLPEDVLRDFEG